MNDRLKFRVWDIDGKEYLKEKQYQYKIVDITVRNNPEQKQDITLYCGSMGSSTLEHCINCKEGFIVEQSTGLKDKNGKLIFEGDILQRYVQPLNRFSYKENYLVKPLGDYLYKGEEYGIFSVYLWGTDCEVIGNIHQNRDLLEKGGE